MNETNKAARTPEEFRDWLAKIVDIDFSPDSQDEEADKSFKLTLAINMMCRILRDHGYDEGVDIFVATFMKKPDAKEEQ